MKVAISFIGTNKYLDYLPQYYENIEKYFLPNSDKTILAFTDGELEDTPDNLKVYHFDLYRIKSVQELIEIDFIDYIYSGNYCFVEWPKICEDLIDINFKEIFIDIISEDKRLIKIN